MAGEGGRRKPREAKSSVAGGLGRSINRRTINALLSSNEIDTFRRVVDRRLRLLFSEACVPRTALHVAQVPTCGTSFNIHTERGERTRTNDGEKRVRQRDDKEDVSQ